MSIIDAKWLPSLIRKDSKQIKIAGVKTLNTIGFDAQKGIIDRAERDMDFRTNARRAMGINVRKARLNSLEVQLFTKRGWLAYHLEDGTRGPEQGWKFNGRRYVLVPVEPLAFTKKNRMKAKFKRNLYIIPYGRDGLVFYRPKRGSKESELIAVLKPKVRFNEDTEPDKVVSKMFKEKAHRLFKFYLNK